MTTALYNLIVYPIELIVEVVFSTINGLCRNPGIAIVGVSFVVSLLVLPLYAKADAIQEAERKKQEKMSRWTAHIKKAFKGDERFMMLTAYYRKENYHPLYSLRSSVSLLLQVPFFIAAYHFLSNLELLNGQSFWLIKDLGRPDGLLTAGGLSVNVLPVLMTLINYGSSYIYTKGFPLKDKLQPYLLALIFLVLLYGSPSGLVLYWTMNNIFSLLKNVVMKLPWLPDRQKPENTVAEDIPSGEKDHSFTGGAVFLTLLTGLLIPSAVIAASPEEFINLEYYMNPLFYVFNTFCISAGYFLLWFSVLYSLMSPGIRKRIRPALWLICGAAATNYFFFGKDLGKMSSMLIFDVNPVYSVRDIAVNLAVLLAVCGVMFIIWKKRKSLVSMIYIISSLSFLVMAGVNAVKTEQVVSGISGISSGAEADADGLPITLSSGGKNVVVIMLDRGISGYIPFIINEKPELKEQFDGFTYYPNTISFGTSTNFGAPALFGGYEYSVDEINKRKDESLVSKHNEALKVMPVIFSSHGFKTTVGNMPWVNYTYVTDFSIYEDYPDIRTVDINGNVNRTDHSLNYPEQEKTRRRDFFMYSVFKIMPLAFQGEVYNRGDYRAAEMPPFFSSQKFLNAYNVLSEFPGLTEVMNNDENTFFVIDNDTAHEPCELQLPEYEPVPAPDNEGLETESRTDGEGNVLEMDEQYHYHTNMAAMLLLGKWLDLLKEKGVYDNTRIVIAADHGEGLGQFDYFMYDEDTDMEYVNPLLMYKDFGARGFSISDDFMTNADTPTLAMQGLIDNPVNPFTGKVIDNKEKTAHNQLVSMSLNWDILKNNGNVFDTSDAEWFEVHDDIFNKNNWKVIEYPSLSGQNRSLTP